MFVFVVIRFTMCDDYYYGYFETLEIIYETFEEAKKYVDDLLLNNKKGYNGKDENSFIQILRMELGNKTLREILFDSNKK